MIKTSFKSHTKYILDRDRDDNNYTREWKNSTKQPKTSHGKTASGRWSQVIRYIVDCDFIHFIKIYRTIKNVFIHFYHDFKPLRF